MFIDKLHNEALTHLPSFVTGAIKWENTFGEKRQWQYYINLLKDVLVIALVFANEFHTEKTDRDQNC